MRVEEGLVAVVDVARCMAELVSDSAYNHAIKKNIHLRYLEVVFSGALPPWKTKTRLQIAEIGF